MIEAIIAVNKVNAIGLKGKLPWSCSDDLKHFKRITMGKHLIVGNTTYKSLPKLKGRTLHVVSKENPLEDILKLNHDFMVIGGASIYNQLLDKCDVIHVSLIDDTSQGDTYFIIDKKLRDKCIYYEFETKQWEVKKKN